MFYLALFAILCGSLGGILSTSGTGKGHPAFAWPCTALLLPVALMAVGCLLCDVAFGDAVAASIGAILMSLAINTRRPADSPVDG